jgi:hypothetical protein
VPALAGHQPLDPLAADSNAVAAQLPMDAAGAIGAPGRFPDLIDVGDQAQVDQVTVTGLLGGSHPLVVGRLGDVEHP